MTLNRIYLKNILGNHLVSGSAISLNVNNIQHDARLVKQGDIFIAIKGTRFDGHDFIEDAVSKGAIGVVGERTINLLTPYWQVTNSVAAFGLIAAAYFDKHFSGRRIGVTGSSGKTTVKNMLYAILSNSQRVLTNEGNFNNEIGLPSTLLKFNNEQCALLEMGARKIGDIKWLTHLFKPEVGILTNIQSAHLGVFGSIENTVQAKSELLQVLPTHGCAVIDSDSAWAQHFKEVTSAHVQTVSNCKVSADVTWQYEDGITTLDHLGESISIRLPMAGKHNAFNAAMAVGAALHLGITLQECVSCLANFTLPGSRQDVLWKGESLIIDDTYNASPEAFKAAIDVLVEKALKLGLPAVVVMGDMLELGEQSIELHKGIGAYASEKNISLFYAVGEHSRHAVDSFMGEKNFFDNKAALIAAIKKNIYATPQTILVKGSRGVGMDEVVQGIA